MRNFKNNFRRNRYKNHGERNSHKNINGNTIIKDLQNGSNFLRKNPNRNNGNASKLVEKYSNLAREALSSGDKILSENYFQHAEHFIRILIEKDALNGKGQNLKNNDSNIKKTNEEKSINKEEQNLNNTKSELADQNFNTEN